MYKLNSLLIGLYTSISEFSGTPLTRKMYRQSNNIGVLNVGQSSRAFIANNINLMVVPFELRRTDVTEFSATCPTVIGPLSRVLVFGTTPLKDTRYADYIIDCLFSSFIGLS